MDSLDIALNLVRGFEQLTPPLVPISTIFSISRLETALPDEIETALLEIDTDLPEIEAALLEFDTVFPEIETALPEIEILS